jgi:hypothetical protein
MDQVIEQVVEKKKVELTLGVGQVSGAALCLLEPVHK